MNQSKKGLSLQEGLNAVVVIGLVGLFLGFFALFNSYMGDANQSNRETATVTNESGAYINATGYTVEGASVNLAEDYTLTAIYNASDGAVITLSNATISSVGVITNATATNWASVNVSYTYTVPTAVENISYGLNTEFQNQTDILGLVLLAVFFGIAITALLASFIVRRSRI